MAPIRLIPREEKFFDLFESAAGHVLEGARAFRDLLANYRDVAAGVEKIKAIEHRCDAVTHETIEKLHKTFLTPIDREDIHAIITGLDEILDMVDAAASRMALYQITQPKAGALETATVIAQAAELVQKALSSLKRSEKSAEIINIAREIRGYEKRADQIYRKALTDLFMQEKDPVTVLKWKDIYDTLEEAADRCEDIANILEGVVVKNG